MTLKRLPVLLIIAFTWLEVISAAAYSNVVVQRGPLDYINYNPSALTFNTPHLAQLTAGGLDQVVSLPAVSSVLSPCVSPCVVPNAPVPALATLPTTTNAKIVAYKSSNLPVILANKEEPRGYTYAYAVFDDQTGDKKTQSEHSDGSIVQGQYSFIQPDGFRRVVVYTADDLKGFNAVVKNISPETEHAKEETHEVNKEVKKPPPCTENKNEHLTVTHEHAEESSEESHKEAEHTDKKSEEKETNEVDSSEHVEKHDVHENHSHEDAHHEDAHHEDAHHEDAHHEDAHPAAESSDHNTNIPNAIISYNDIINCLQTKLQGSRNVVSPLTYVLIPSSKSPC